MAKEEKRKRISVTGRNGRTVHDSRVKINFRHRLDPGPSFPQPAGHVLRRASAIVYQFFFILNIAQPAGLWKRAAEKAKGEDEGK